MGVPTIKVMLVHYKVMRAFIIKVMKVRIIIKVMRDLIIIVMKALIIVL